jgi:uncharacterized membrane protein
MLGIRQFVKQNGALLVILLVGGVLRFWNFLHIPFQHDEYSALRRSSFNSLSDVIQKGVITDGHPPLSHLFLYVWIKIGGTSEWWVKLPFLVMGMASLVLFYLLAQRWFNQSVALIGAAFLAVLQESVMHSQMARPYALGLFLVLLTSWQLQINDDKKIEDRTFVRSMFIGLLIALTAYTHHFSAITIFIIGVYFFSKAIFKSNTKILWIMLPPIVLYVPNLFILKYQLNMPLILAPPASSILADYFSYLFNFNKILLGLIALPTAIGFLFYRKEYAFKPAFISLLVFGCTALFAYYYSIYRAPIFHFRALYFSMPFLLLFLIAPLGNLRPALRNLSILLILSVGTYSLVAERHYFKTFYTGGYEFEALTAQELSAQKPTTSLLSYSQDMLNYQIQKHNLSPQLITNADSSWQMGDYVRFIDQCSSEQFVFGYTSQFYHPPMEVLGMLYDKYQNVSLHQDYFNSNLYAFAKSPVTDEGRIVSSELIAYDISDQLLSPTSTFPKAASFQNADEYGYTISSTIPNSEVEIPDWLIVSAKIAGENTANAKIVLQITEHDSSVCYIANDLSVFKTDSTFNAYAGVFSPDIFKKGHNYKLSSYIWNQAGEFRVLDMNLIAIRGNKIMYCLDRPIEKSDLKHLP